MSKKVALTLTIPEHEYEALCAISKQKDVSKNSIIRQAFYLYQLIDKRLSEGERLCFTNEKGLTSQVEIVF